jgi:hypothetical protein
MLDEGTKILDHIDYEGYRYCYKYRMGKDGDICLGTKDPGNGFAFVVIAHNNPNDNWYEN